VFSIFVSYGSDLALSGRPGIVNLRHLLYILRQARHIDRRQAMNRKATSTGTIRAAALQGFRRMVSNMGAEPDGFLNSAGIDPRALDSPDNRISYAAMIALLEDCAVQLGCPDFGLRLSSYQDIDILGPAAMIARYSDTVGDSLKSIASYLYVHTSGAVVRVTPVDEDLTSLSFEVVLPGLHAKRQINELSVGIGQSMLEMLIGPGFRCQRVQFMHRRPDEVKPLIQRFGPRLEFGHAVNALILESTNLERPVATANTEFRQIALGYIREHLGDAEDNRLRRVVLLVHQFLPTGRCSLHTVAEVLNMHPRTLQRELASFGKEFRSIVDRIRQDLAVDYLANSDASLTQVADMLGYGDQAAFNNAFRRWHGVAPGKWRKARLMGSESSARVD
jgi:AraC-like DNA-binding protein